MIDPEELAAWAKARGADLKSPVAKAIYAGIETRAQRPDGFALRANTSKMDEPAGAGTEEER